jgi:dihydroneopterin aldolase
MEVSRLPDASLPLRRVFLRNMILQARIGVHPHEHGRGQRIRLNIDLAVDDDGAAAISNWPVGPDDLSRVVDYETMATNIRALVDLQHVKLVETLAERIANSCLADARVFVARVRIEKLDVFDDTEAAGVEVERRRR